MNRFLTAVVLAGVAVGAVACTDSERARRAATWKDQPADITCWTYGTENFRGRSTGKIEYDDGGRVSFVDAASGRYTTVEGDCRVVYLGDDDEQAVPAAAAFPTTEAPAA